MGEPIPLLMTIILMCAATGIFVRSIQSGGLNMRAGLSWGLVFGLGMGLWALPGVTFILLVRRFGWPVWLESWHQWDPEGKNAFAILALVSVPLVTWAAMPALARLDRRLCG